MSSYNFPLRLQVYMAKCGVGSRRYCEELIEQKRVMVNNKIIKEQGFKVHEDDIVQFDGETIELSEKKYYIVLNKPRGYVCTNYDPHENLYARELIDIKDQDLLFNVGRLDKDSNGLIIFTNDGEFSNIISHPRYNIEKEYLVKVDKALVIDDLNKALDGIYIDNPKPYKIIRYDLVPRTRQFVKITLNEGKNREIRKIFSFLGYDVKSLTRIRIGCIELGNLEVGKWRDLTKDEREGLLSGKNNSKVIKKSKVRGNKSGNSN